MSVSIVANGDTCNLVEIDSGGRTANVFTLPLPRAEIVTLLRDLLADPEARQIEAGILLVERMRDGVRVHHSRANFTIPWGYLFPILAQE